METIKNKIKQELTEGRIAKIYAATYRSLIDRIDEDGLVPESIVDGEGSYGRVEFCRTIGALYALFEKTGEYELIERTIRYTLDVTMRIGLKNRVPHMIYRARTDEDGVVRQTIPPEDQPDASCHVINAWARFVLSGKASAEFEDQYYDFLKQMLNILCDQPYFWYSPYDNVEPYVKPFNALKLIFNSSFEHSRLHRWSAWDLLTQSFFGAALESMSGVAKKRGDTEAVDFWQGRIQLLREGIDQYLTREIDGKKMYLEMRVPDGGMGRPFTGMGWVNLSPVAAGWEALAPEVLDNSIEYMRKKLWKDAPFTDGKQYMAAGFDEEDQIDPRVFCKAIGWDIAYSAEREQYDDILRWLEYLSAVNNTEILAERFAEREDGWYHPDPGNGEQCYWWCWGIAILREKLGLPVVP